MRTINELCDVVRETAFAIHCYHRNGHLEKDLIVAKQLLIELKAARAVVEAPFPNA